MDGQVLGGGVVVLVAALLWLAYLVPTWYQRQQFTAAERNAVRLNQALRVLAETSETPRAVELELTARSAYRQQRLAKRLRAVREDTAAEELRAELAAAEASPAARRARARRRARLLATAILVASLAMVGTGIWQVTQAGPVTLVWAGGSGLLLGAIVLSRANRRQAAAQALPLSQETAVQAGIRSVVVQDLPLEDKPAASSAGWTPRPLPRPLSQAPGSRAATELAVAEAREALRRAAQDEAARVHAARRAPVPIRKPGTAATGSADLARVGEPPQTPASFASDAELEAHVRALLRSRAAG